MSKLEELMKELCPNGVEWKRLGEIAEITRGGSFQKKDFLDEGIPCIHYGQIYTHYGIHADKTIKFVSPQTAKSSRMAKHNDIIMAVTSENVEDVGKSVAWVGNEDIAVSGHTAIIHHSQNAKYLSYYFNSSHFFAQKIKISHGTKVIEISPKDLDCIIIPVPPLPVQEEIVRILDNFSELQAELQAELQKRIQQYNFYRDKLLSFNENAGGNEVRWMKLGEISEIYDGTHKTPKYTTTGIAFISVENIKDIYHSKKYISKDAYHEYKIRPQVGDVFMTRIGDIGTCAVMEHEADLAYYVSLALIRPKPNNVHPHFLKYLIESRIGRTELRKRTLINAVPIKINKNDIGELKFPIPPLAEQERIVSILDRFDALCTDLSAGLPAEIEGRRKQYEYYRDKLLSFTPLS